MEIILVLAIIALVAAVAVPSFRAWSEGYRLQQGVDHIRTHWVKARTMAMEEGRPYRFFYEIGTGHYKLAPDDFENWPELAGSINGPTTSAGGYPPGLFIEDILPQGVTFVSVFDDQATAALVFWPDGTAKIYGPDGSEHSEMVVGLMDSKGYARFLHVRGLTGGVSVVNLGGY
jgi:hypothetical protein